jgi:proline dehydrogenase
MVSISPEPAPPVWRTKAETDACYDACADALLDAVAANLPSASALWSWFGARTPAPGPPRVGVLFGTHNWGSCRRILDALVQKGMARIEGKTAEGEAIVGIGSEVTERVTLAQLYGAWGFFFLGRRESGVLTGL